MIGSVVKSVKGRDEGKYYILRDIINDYFVYVCDGEKKTYSKPKRKNRKHIIIVDCEKLILSDELCENDPKGNETHINDKIKKHLKCHVKEV